MQTFGEQKADHLKIFVMMRGKPLRILERFVRPPGTMQLLGIREKSGGRKEHGFS
jgi:hypothetical protein